jgi:hypothetical protein
MNRFFLIGLAGLLAASCGAKKSDDAETVTVTELPRPHQNIGEGFETRGQGIAIISGSQAASIDVSLPPNLVELDPGLATTLRERVQQDTEKFVNSARTERTEAENGGYPFRPHEIELSWEDVGPQATPFASYLGTYFTYTGGAHPNTTFETLNWDLDRRREITFEDLFQDADAARDTIRSALFEAIVKAKSERLGDLDTTGEDILETWVRPAFENNAAIYDKFTIVPAAGSDKAGGLIYHFQPYEIGSYAEGPYEIGLPAQVFGDQLVELYADAFEPGPLDFRSE